MPLFELEADLQKYLEDSIFPKVRIPEGGAEVHHWIYEKAKRKCGLQPPVSITEAVQHDFDLADADTQTLLSIMGAGCDDDAGPDDEVLTRNPRSDDPKTWKANGEREVFMEPVDAEDDDGQWTTLSSSTGRWTRSRALGSRLWTAHVEGTAQAGYPSSTCAQDSRRHVPPTRPTRGAGTELGSRLSGASASPMSASWSLASTRRTSRGCAA